MSAQNEQCNEAWCFDKYGERISELQFDPHSIKWPLHFTGDSLKDVSDGGKDNILVRYLAHDFKKILPLAQYRGIVDDEDFCKNGIGLPDPFECAYGYTGKPSYRKTSCSLIGVSKEEREIRFGTSSCYKKIIDWTIIDWCVYDPKKGSERDDDDLFLIKDLITDKEYFAYDHRYGKIDRDGAYHYQQVIKIGDHTQPEVIHDEEIVVNADASCQATITIGNRANDPGECPSESFRWTVKLYSEDKGATMLDPVQIGEDSVEVEISDLDPGIYHIKWRVTDACNNPSETKQKLEVKDTKSPVIICKGSLSAGVGSKEDPVKIWANDLVKSVFDNCSDVVVSFNPDSLVNVLELNCREHGAMDELPIYATDDFGNQSFCLIKTRFSATDTSCFEKVQFAGSLMNKSGVPITSASIKIMDIQDNELGSIISDQSGRFAFEGELPVSDEYHIVINHSDAELIRKVTTLDLMTIQKHILGREEIIDEYARMAADVDHDGDIDGYDIKLVRNYLLGLQRLDDDSMGWGFYLTNTGSTGNNFSIIKDQSMDLVAYRIGDVID